MCWNAKYALLLLFSTAVTYLSGLAIDAAGRLRTGERLKSWMKKLTVVASFLLNLGVLFYFKYVNFAISLITPVFRRMHIELNLPEFDILLPVGISFFTFQALSYTMDVYRNEIYAEKNFFRYALFVSFFPQLVAGPIERSKNLLKQLAVPKQFSFDDAKEGIYLMLWGYFLKLVLADRIAIFVDSVYGDIKAFPGWYLIVATALFAAQIYCDFGGYSTIACGVAKVLGIRLMENFNAPYLSTSVAQFWRDWHISLTSWFRDYLYIPLGGGRRGKLRKYINKLTVFLVSGLWHGASMTFVIWGGLNGLYQIIGEMLEPLRKRLAGVLGIHRDSFGHRLLSGVVTFVLVDFSWIFFRAQTYREAVGIIRSIAQADNLWILFDKSLYKCGLDQRNFLLMVFCIVILLLADLMKRKGIVVRQAIARQDAWFQILVIVAAVSFILTFGIWGPVYDEAGFIYFQF